MFVFFCFCKNLRFAYNSFFKCNFNNEKIHWCKTMKYAGWNSTWKLSVQYISEHADHIVMFQIFIIIAGSRLPGDEYSTDVQG